MTKHINLMSILIVMIAGLPTTGMAEAIYRYQVQLPGESALQNMDVSVGDNDLAIKGYQEGEMIYRGQEQQMVGIDHRDKTYFILDLQTVKSLATTVGAALQQMRQELQALPPEQREMIEQQMKQQFGITDGGEPETLELEKADRRGDAAGIGCDWWEVIEDGELIREVCSADPSDVPGGDQSLAIMKGLGKLQAEIYDEMSESVPIELPDNPFAMLEEMNGLPIITHGLNSHLQEGSMTLVSAEEASLPADTFRPPKDYKKQSLDPSAN